MVIINGKHLEGEYSIAQWDEDMRLNRFCNRHENYFFSGCNIACPSCQNFGFYGPKGSPERMYRACKFCGFWQEADGSGPYRCIALFCADCDVYDWTQPRPDNNYHPCKCGRTYVVIDWASDNPHHAFHRLKKEMDMIHLGNS